MGSVWIWLLLVIFYTRSKSKFYIIETFDEEKKAHTNGHETLDYENNDLSSSNLDELVQSLFGFGKGGDYGDNPDNTTEEVKEAKKIITTDIAYSILTTPEGEQAKFNIGNETEIPICLSVSLKTWKKEKGYKKVKENQCQKKNQDSLVELPDNDSNDNNSTGVAKETFVLPEIATTGNKSAKNIGKHVSDRKNIVNITKERIDSWDELDKKLKDPKQPWSKFTRDEIPSTFDKNFVDACDALQLEMEKFSLDEFIGKIGFIKDNKHINKVIYKQALVRALFSRNDTSNDVLSPLELNSESFVEKNITTGSDYFAWRTAILDKNITISKELKYFEANDPEEKMDYWREDLLLHVFHDFWHTISKRAYPKVRKGERFVFAHNEFLKRYYIEREMNDMSSISCDTGEEFYETLPDTYEPKLFNTFYKKRPKNCQIKAESIKELKKERKELLSKLEELKNDGEKFAYHLEWPYHGKGHMRCSQDCKVGSGYSAMWSSATSARDPIFYQWHCEIQRVWQLWMDLQPNYEKNDMDVDIEVVKVWVESEGNHNNTLKTFMEDTSLQHKESYTINYQRLNHEKFTITFKLKNIQQKRKNVIIRIFLGKSIKGKTYKGYSKDSEKVIQMDRFVVELNGEKNQEVTRHSIESALTMKESGTTLSELGKQISKFKNQKTKKYAAPFCGWPHNLLIPKGGKKGVAFDLIVVVNDVDQNVTEGRDTVDHILCGHSNPKALLDNRPFGFPFDRPWNFELNDIKSIKTLEVLIFHGADEVKQSISGIDNVNQTLIDIWTNGTRTDDKNAKTVVLESGIKLQIEEIHTNGTGTDDKNATTIVLGSGKKLQIEEISEGTTADTLNKHKDDETTAIGTMPEKITTIETITEEMTIGTIPEEIQTNGTRTDDKNAKTIVLGSGEKIQIEEISEGTTADTLNKHKYDETTTIGTMPEKITTIETITEENVSNLTNLAYDIVNSGYNK